MALKAGTVGVNPDYVDNNDAPIASSIKAGDKILKFVTEDGKIGYKDDDGTFHPFDDAGAVGFNLPDATITGLSMEEVVDGQAVDLPFTASGGYQVYNGDVYVDIIIKCTPQTSNVIINGFPPTLGSNWRYMQRSGLNALDNMGIDTIAFKKDDMSNTMYGEFTTISNYENMLRITGIYILGTI